MPKHMNNVVLQTVCAGLNTQSLAVLNSPYFRSLLDKNKLIESISSEHTRAKLRQYLNDISKKK